VWNEQPPAFLVPTLRSPRTTAPCPPHGGYGALHHADVQMVFLGHGRSRPGYVGRSGEGTTLGAGARRAQAAANELSPADLDSAMNYELVKYRYGAGAYTAFCLTPKLAEPDIRQIGDRTVTYTHKGIGSSRARHFQRRRGGCGLRRSTPRPWSPYS
jgi:hypothetical protein